MATALNGEYTDLHEYNLIHAAGYNEQLFSFARWNNEEKMIVISQGKGTIQVTLAANESRVMLLQSK